MSSPDGSSTPGFAAVHPGQPHCARKSLQSAPPGAGGPHFPVNDV